MTVKIYGQPGCGNCNTAKVKFHRASAPHEYIELNDQIKQDLTEKYGTLPRSLPWLEFDGEVHLFAKTDELIKKVKQIS